MGYIGEEFHNNFGRRGGVGLGGVNNNLICIIYGD